MTVAADVGTRTQHGGRVYTEGPKSAAGVRTVSLPPVTVDALREWGEACDKLRGAQGMSAWTTKPGAVVLVDPATWLAWPPSSISQAMRRILGRFANETGRTRISAQGLRKSFSEILLDRGVQPATVAAILGHADKGATVLRNYNNSRRADQVSASALFGSLMTPTASGE